MTIIAPIKQQNTREISFQVDEVEIAKDRLSLDFASSILEKKLGKKLLIISHTNKLKLVNNIYIHPLVAAVGFAFNEHRPLLLTPDMIWITIAQGFNDFYIS